MSDRQRILQPLEEAQPSLERLEAYEDQEQLAASVDAVWRAVDRSLRLRLRLDPDARDEQRLHALSANVLATDAVIAALRERGRITLELAGMALDLGRAADRARSGRPRAADADLAQATAARLRSEIEDAPAEDAAAPAVVGPAAGSEPVPGLAPLEEDPAGRRRSRRLYLFAAAIFFLGGLVMLISVLRGPRHMEAGVAAFEAGQLEFAEREFRAAVERDGDNVTALVYLGRIYRRTGRAQEAADVLRAAAARAPEDSAVLRELGHLFMDLDRPSAAAEQFRRAVEVDEEEHANWIGLIHALRAAGDPAAEEWLRVAPAQVRAQMTPAAPVPPYQPGTR
jgi:tetratricopeptide (TPR) repeat protein